MNVTPARVLLLTALIGGLPLVLLRILERTYYFVADQPSYLTFHNVSEFFSVMVALSIFGVAWYSHEQSGNRHSLFLGTAFLGIGLLDFMHALGYTGMPAFITPNSPLKSTEYWIAARFYMASAFLISAYVSPASRLPWLTKPVLLGMNLGVPLLVFVAITFFPGYVPATYIESTGLTPFKTYTEYLIIGLLAWSLVVYWRRFSKAEEQWLIYLMAAFILCILSESQFSSYQSVFDTYNIIGHLYKIAAFYLIYRGIFSTSVKLPYIGMQQANRSLNSELEENQRISKELARHRGHLEELVSERTAQLKGANEDLESFAYSVSHDLRVPLRAIDGFSHQLLKHNEDKLDDESRRYLNLVRENAKRMATLIDDILAFSRMGRAGMSSSEIDMGGLVRNVVDELRPSFSGRDITMDIKSLAPAVGDQALLRQVWINLMSNAIKFTRNKSTAVIRVGSYQESGENVYFVKDNGAGFDMQFVQQLFGVFRRLHTAEEFEGTGIGLAIVKRIITRHGGRVWAEGKLNEGATIYFTLPVQPARQG